MFIVKGKSLSADLKFDNIYSTQYFAILMVRENVDSIIDRIRDFREAGAHFFQLNLLHGIHLPPAY